MIQRVCPICDQVMHSRHYCKICKSWIKNPYVRDVTFYLNERHPAEEMDCSYHNGTHPADMPKPMPGTGTQKPGNQAAVKKTEKATSPWTPNPAGNAGASGNQRRGNVMQPAAAGSSGSRGTHGTAKTTRNSRKSKNTGIIIVVIILLALKVLPSLAVHSFHSIERAVSQVVGSEYDVDMGDFSGEDESWAVDYHELEDREVVAAGEQCNSVGHFDITGTKAKQLMEYLVGDYGLALEERGQYSYNEAYEDGTTWYATWVDCSLKGRIDRGEEYIELEYDTATRALHQINVVVEDPERLQAMTRDILNLMNNHDAMLPDENCAQTVDAELAQALVNDGMYELQSGSVCVDAYSEGSNYSVYIYRTAD